MNPVLEEGREAIAEVAQDSLAMRRFEVEEGSKLIERKDSSWEIFIRHHRYGLTEARVAKGLSTYTYGGLSCTIRMVPPFFRFRHETI